jgi:hypothetical protein
MAVASTTIQCGTVAILVYPQFGHCSATFGGPVPDFVYETPTQASGPRGDSHKRV